MNSSIPIQAFFANDDLFNFMNMLKETPAYWKQIELEVPVIIKQLGLPTILVTLPCTGLWILNYNNTVEKMVGIISNLNENDLLASKEIQNLNYSDRTRILNSNPVLIRYFQYRVEVLFKEIIVEIEKICHKSSVSSQRRSTYSFANMGNWCTSFFKVSNKHEHINFDDCTAESI